MSRIGKQPVTLPSGVEATVSGSTLSIKGSKGALTQEIPAGVTVAQEENRLLVTRSGDTKQARSLHGLTRALVKNMVVGVTEGYAKELDIVGVSFQATLTGKKLTMKLGYANEITLEVPDDVLVEVPNPTRIKVSGPDKQKVGQFAAQVRQARPPEPYKGKGVRYRDETVQRKQGKSFVGSE